MAVDSVSFTANAINQLTGIALGSIRYTLRLLTGAGYIEFQDEWIAGGRRRTYRRLQLGVWTEELIPAARQVLRRCELLAELKK